MTGVAGDDSLPLAVLDANVLYSASIRHLLIALAVSRAYYARWTLAIEEEWVSALLRTRPDLDVRQINRTRELMALAVPDALVIGFEQHIADLQLPDPDDRHVVAAAIAGRASHIVTFNRGDFPRSTLSPFGIQVESPDQFINGLIDRDVELVVEAARMHRADLRKPARTPEEYVDSLRSNGLELTASKLVRYLGDL